MSYRDISNARKIAFQAGNLTENLHYQGIDQGVVFTLHNRLTFGLNLHLVSPARATMDVRIAIRDRLMRAIQGALPAGTVVRHYTETRPSTKSALDACAPAEKNGGGLEGLLKANHQVLENLRQNGYVSATSSYLTVTLQIKGRRRKTPFRNGEEKPYVEHAARLRSTLERQLMVAGMSATAMTTEECWARIMDYFNPAMASAEKPPLRQELSIPDLKALPVLRKLRKKGERNLPSIPSMRAQVACSDIDLDFDDCFMLGRRRVGVVSFLNPAGSTKPDATERVIQALGGTHSTFMVEYVVVDTPKMRASVNEALDRQETAVSDASAKPGREILTRISEGNALVQNMEMGRVFTTMSMHAIIYARSQAELDERTERTLAAFSGVGGCMPRIASSGNLIHLFLQHAPFSGEVSDYQVPCYYENATDCIPKVGSFPGSAGGVLPLRARNGNVFSINPLDMRNGGIIVSGSAGYGKSVLINMLSGGLVHRFETSLTVVDPKQDYWPLFMALGAMDSIFPIGVDAILPDGRRAVINPFDLASGQFGPDEDKLEFLEELMIALGVHDCTGRTSTIFKEAFRNFYYRFSEPIVVDGREVMAYTGQGTMSDFRDVLARLNNVGDLSVLTAPGLRDDVQNIANNLSMACGNTPLGRLLDGHSTLDMRGRYVCLDVSGMMNGSERFRKVGMLLTSTLVWKRNLELQGRKVVVIEEGGVARQLPGYVNIVNRLFLTGRGPGFIPILAVQNIEDAEAYKGVINNAATRILLGCNPNERAEVARVFGLNDSMRSLHASLGGEKGRYSEALVLQDGKNGELDGDVGQLWLSREAYWMTTSTREEADYRREVAQRLYSGDEALAALHIAQEAQHAA